MKIYLPGNLKETTPIPVINYLHANPEDSNGIIRPEGEKLNCYEIFRFGV